MTSPISGLTPFLPMHRLQAARQPHCGPARTPGCPKRTVRHGRECGLGQITRHTDRSVTGHLLP